MCRIRFSSVKDLQTNAQTLKAKCLKLLLIYIT
ncbi:hypothetical protein HH_0480 [Helicobacter hepaticus ATCC 51449]|uniref:Uncharacterized protein n=1 Tax=Helicobacter hepaticus (strain ATCC 51449 / 3B1) TaxID=235279 RepID=Q7VIX4_HELHP|nr:hypothetical protein HH_0480 [Helicobacter hepaticus ATCC 51449]